MKTGKTNETEGLFVITIAVGQLWIGCTAYSIISPSVGFPV